METECSLPYSQNKCDKNLAHLIRSLWSSRKLAKGSLHAKSPFYVSIIIQQGATIYSLLISAMFQVVSPPIIRSLYHCICSIWHYWDRHWYLSWRLVHGLSNARNCRYSDMSSCWWVEIPPKRVEQFADINKLYMYFLSSWFRAS